MPQIFLSYAHADAKLHASFVEALQPLVSRIEGLTLWWDAELKAGQAWDARIRAAIDASDVFVCLVTNAFLKPGGYILREELPAIRAAAKSRGALILPVIAQPSHWQEEFGEIQAVPKTKKGELRPISKWRPAQEGHHEASVQLKKPILDHLNALPPRPDPGPGPAMAPTPEGFALVGRPPSEAERADAGLRGHHADILDALDRLKPFLQGLDNVDHALVEAIGNYDKAARADFAALPLDRLWSIGARLGERIEMADAADLAAVFDAKALREVRSELHRLRDSHAVLILGTEEGRALTGRVAAYRSATRPLDQIERSAYDVPQPMTTAEGLLEPATRDFVGRVAAPLGEGSERVDEIEAGLLTALHAIAAFTAIFEPWTRAGDAGRADAAALRRRFADDANLDTILAAFAFLDRHRNRVAQFARDNPDLRRYVERTLAALEGRRSPPLVDPDPPPDFDLDEVHAMIRRGEAPPRDWARFVNELDFSGESDFVDLGPLAGLTQLQQLDVSDAGVVDVGPLAGLTQLQQLDVSDTGVVDFGPLSGLTRMREIYASGSGIIDLGPLAGLTQLHELYVSGSGVVDLGPLAGLAQLRLLSAVRTGVVDLGPLAGLAQLQMLDVGGGGVVDLGPLAGLAQLQMLNLDGSGVVDLGPLSGLTQLQWLDARGTGVVDLGPLSGLTQLQRIDIGRTGVVDLGPLAGLTQLRELYVSGITDIDLSAVAALPALEVLAADDLRGAVVWPRVWPGSLTQVTLAGSPWPSGEPLPPAPWRIDPDGTIHRGEGNEPYPFVSWVYRMVRTSSAAEGGDRP